MQDIGLIQILWETLELSQSNIKEAQNSLPKRLTDAAAKLDLSATTLLLPDQVKLLKIIYQLEQREFCIFEAIDDMQDDDMQDRQAGAKLFQYINECTRNIFKLDRDRNRKNIAVYLSCFLVLGAVITCLIVFPEIYAAFFMLPTILIALPIVFGIRYYWNKVCEDARNSFYGPKSPGGHTIHSWLECNYWGYHFRRYIRVLKRDFFTNGGYSGIRQSLIDNKGASNAKIIFSIRALSSSVGDEAYHITKIIAGVDKSKQQTAIKSLKAGLDEAKRVYKVNFTKYKFAHRIKDLDQSAVKLSDRLLCGFGSGFRFRSFEFRYFQIPTFFKNQY